MMACVKSIDWDDISVAVPSFMTMAIMPFTYNISYGIAFGLISYVAVKLISGEGKEIKAGTWVVMAMFLALLLLTH